MGSSLEAVVNRLEAVASRLERLEMSASSTAGSAAATPRNIPAASPTAAAAPSAATASAGGALGEYDAALSPILSIVTSSAQSVGGDVLKATNHVAAAFNKQRTLIALAQLAKQPNMTELQGLLQMVGEEMMAAGALADDRRSPAFQQLKVVAETLNGLQWLAYTGPACGMPLPPQHIADSWNSAEFYANKLMMALRGKDETQMAWLKGIKDLSQVLQKYVRQHFPQGLKWNPNGCSLADAQKQVAAGGGAAAPAAAPAAAAPRKGPPAAPPPPPVEVLLQERPAAPAAASKGSGGMQDVFRQLSGGGVTAGLRKVTDAMKAKNRTDRSGHVPSTAEAPAVAAPAPAAAAAKGAPAMGKARIQLEADRKWVVEHHSGNREIVVERTDPKHTVYIYNCHNCVVQVRGKVNAVSIDNCKRTGVVFDQVIATCELVNCSSMQVQCTGKVPTVSVDKCDGCQVFVNDAVAKGDFQLVTAKSSEVNLTVVPSDPNADAVEHAVPEQFISSFKGGKLVTVAASHSGG